MAEEVTLLGSGSSLSRAFQPDRAAGWRKQAGDQPQQRRFARAVAPRDGERFAAIDSKIERGKHLASTPDTPHIAARQPHELPLSLSRAFYPVLPTAACESRPFWAIQMGGLLSKESIGWKPH